MLQAIRYKRGSLELLDQRELPTVTTYIPVTGTADAWNAIRDMAVRGAPAIAIAAMLGLAVELQAGGAGSQYRDAEEARREVDRLLAYLVSSRPTAVNLAQAADRLRALAAAAAGAAGASAGAVVRGVIEAAEGMLEADVAANRALGAAGAAATRPYNQGARLTAYELLHDGLPATLIVDGAVPARMAAGQVDAVVVGADRVAANGDTANKIGTYAVALAAAAHGVPFFVAAPTTTLDPATPCGASIEIEERDPREVTHAHGRQVAPEGIDVWNPSFDVTPARLIAGIITERGVIVKGEDEVFDVAAFLRGVEEVALDVESVRRYVQSRPELCRLVGDPASAADWDVREVGDGNINFVFLIDNPRGGSLCIKQSLPFVRMVGPDWPLTQARLAVEVEALRTQARLCPRHVPGVHLFDPERSLVAMDRIPPPHAILRGALVRGERFPLLGAHVAEFLAQTLYHTSYLHLGAAAFWEQVRAFENRGMCALTEQVIFTDPYHAARHNRPLAAAPHLEAIALLHGDFHTGSLMVTHDSTFVIDAEFAFCGPIGFELGKWVANLFLAFFGAPGHGLGAADLRAQRAWLLEAARESWHGFLSKFTDLCALDDGAGVAGEEEGVRADLGACTGAGTVLSALLFEDGEARRRALAAVLLDEVAAQAGVFAGTVMIRRIVGLARVADLEQIADPQIKAAQESAALAFGVRLLHGLSFDAAADELQSLIG
ncbi:hypothetical protein QBZ16_000224 [Prototheca wickerhamii]|uniref:Methylthioribose-1-phosphate isomerase n=1 Tax=Prototheca wickerhamii TaxID=3111 RepID=A0AAD9MP55_PROWI|nr:hypothetical protein QBZ16_000224 [Prototheca wickerhamii]